MKIVPRVFALALLHGNKKLMLGRYDLGKYKWTGSEKDYIGTEIKPIQGVHAVFAERRQDQHGPHAVLRSIHETW